MKKTLYFALTMLFIAFTGFMIKLTIKRETKTVLDKIDTTMSEALSKTIKSNKPSLITDYEMELISQDSLLIYNGSEVKQIHFDDIQQYIISDNE